MPTKNILETLYPKRITEPATVQDIPRGVYMVYILTYNDTPIVVGHGKHNRKKNFGSCSNLSNYSLQNLERVTIR